LATVKNSLPKIKSGWQTIRILAQKLPLRESGILTVLRLLTVRRMFSLLYYLHILAHTCGNVKNFFDFSGKKVPPEYPPTECTTSGFLTRKHLTPTYGCDTIPLTE